MDNRAVSVTVSYVITLIIATLLIGGILMAAGGLIESQSNTAALDELDVLGQKLAANIMSADRSVTIAQNDVNSTEFTEEDIDVNIRSSIPRQVSGSNYHIIVNWDDQIIQLSARNSETIVEVSFVADHRPGGSTALSPGRIRVYFDGEHLQVENP